MHFREVALKLKAAQKIFAANFALELGGVGSAVRDQGRGLGEPFTTLRTYVRFLLRNSILGKSSYLCYSE